MRDEGWLVCGWFTPDYRPWAEKLIASLNTVGAPYDIVETQKLVGGWEANTMAKAEQILAAMDRHPGKVIVFLDVDCEVRGDLSPLAQLRGDVAFLLPVKKKARGARLKPLSGTMVVRPTPQARWFVEAWASASAKSHWGAIDQHTLAVAMSSAPGVTIEPLDSKWCGLPGQEHLGAVIQHDNASRTLPKLTTTRRRLWALWQTLIARPSHKPAMPGAHRSPSPCAGR